MLLVRTRCLLQLQLLLLSTTVTTNCAAANVVSSSYAGHGGDEGALLAFKAKISRRSAGVLDSWNKSTISPVIGNLTFLRSLNLSFNTLQGEIPPSIGSLRHLWHIDLSENMLTGAIPSNISRCISLRTMNISSNKGVQGSIPAEIGNMPSLSVLMLYNNSITGTIPSSLGNLSRLTKLSLSSNYLEGSIPEGIGNNPYLRVIQLSTNNLSGLLPPSLYNLSSVYYFYVAVNKLHGHLPSDMGKSLPSIQSMGIGGNRFTGALPQSISNISRLQKFYAGFNSFTGTVPSGLGRLQNLEVFVLDFNMLEANNNEDWEFIASLTNCSRLQMLSIGGNRLAGKLPSSLANLTTNLQWLRTPRNYISGVIPSDIGNLASLANLDFSENILTGAIPEGIGELKQLSQLYLYSNNFKGHIPSSIGNLTGLSELDAHGNSLEGPIPPTIGNLGKLSALDLSHNKLTGVMPNKIMELSSITILFDLSYNLLEGPLPLEVSNFVNLRQLSISGNKLSGEIPNTISNCRVMEILLMDGNSFQGSIPSAFKNMAGLTILNLTDNKLNGSIPGYLASITNLQELYLSHNNLSGSIPEELGNSKSVLRLDLSFNNLQGEVPKGGAFRNITGISIVGNNALCGGIPQLHLPECPRKTKKSMPKYLRIAIPTAGALLLILSGLVCAGFLYQKLKTPLKKEIAPQFTERDLPIVPYSDIQSFQAECEALRRVRHRCLVNVITCCSSINRQGQDFRAIVFELMANGSLDRWIHSNYGALSLSHRLDIAVDVVDALDYLHNGCHPPIIHCDLKPSNILLNHDMRGHIGDFGIARVLDQSTSKNPMNSNSSIGIRGTIGYIAPEYGEGLAVSTFGDVYSLGVTLIEMFTGRSPTDDMFRDGMSLHCFAEASLPDKVMEIADPNMWLHDGLNTKNDTTHMTSIKECMSSVIQLGVLCSRQQAIERPSVSEADSTSAK